MTEDKMVGWHHLLKGHEFQQALGDGEGQGSLACCSPWGHKKSDRTEQLNNDSNCARITVQIQMCFELLKLSRTMWGSQVKILFVSHFLFLGNRLHSSSLTFPDFQRADTNSG